MLPEDKQYLRERIDMDIIHEWNEEWYNRVTYLLDTSDWVIEDIHFANYPARIFLFIKFTDKWIQLMHFDKHHARLVELSKTHPESFVGIETPLPPERVQVVILSGEQYVAIQQMFRRKPRVKKAPEPTQESWSEMLSKIGVFIDETGEPQ